eukprot:TRINITY_DN22864_c0_g1_i1.p1 TRINITY_DN22864_c0_g1~~TRINITY_DN22864_c0_g1_i1.p1  ORF type:complete len:250 (-),score=51.51 TRINITY_DN22864_c0_g1_i1:200-949(-)
MSSDSMGLYSVKFVGHTQADGHTTYVIMVTNPEGVSWQVQKRYREIRELHDELRLRYGDSMPAIPGKRLWGNQDPAFVAARQVGLEQYLTSVLQQVEREVRSPALLQFLGRPEPGERNQARQYQQILDSMQSKLLNLALPPAPLDETEMAQRLKKYGQAMRLHVLSQPVDPIHLRAPGFDNEPLALCPSNAEHFDSLKVPNSDAAAEDRRLLTDLMDNLHKVLKPAQPLADPNKLIVPFPHVSLPSSDA